MKAAAIILTLVLALGVSAVAAPRTTPVTVENSPTVGISPGANTVQTTTKSQQIQLWATNQSVGNGAYLWAPMFDCAGYKEIRFAIHSNSSSASLKVIYRIQVGVTVVDLGYATFAPAPHSITDQANFTPYAGWCLFTAPVIADICTIAIYNQTGGSVQIDSTSVAYLVN